jgi:hypothetical protein
MTAFRKLFFSLLAAALLVPALPVLAAAADVELRVYDPRAERWTPPSNPIQPRLSTLNGKKIALINNTKPGADYIDPFVEKVLKEKFPEVEIKVFVISYNAYPTKAEDLRAVAEWADGVVGTLGD